MRDPLRVVSVATNKNPVRPTSRDWRGEGSNSLNYTVVLRLSRSMNSRELDALERTGWNPKFRTSPDNSTQLHVTNITLEEIEQGMAVINERLAQAEKDALAAELADEKANTEDAAREAAEDARLKAITDRINKNLQ